MRSVRLLYVQGCPNWRDTDARLRALQTELGFTVDRHRVDTPEEAQRLGFGGSPTLLVDGVDPFANGAVADGLACRLYDAPTGVQGSPTIEQLRAVLR
jgi:hypothetical protein